MRARYALVAIAVVVAAGAHAEPARAQSLIPPVTIIGDASGDDGSDCSLGTALICAAGTLVGGAGDLIGGAAKAGADAVMGGIVNWAAGGAAWLLRTIAHQVERSTRPQLGSPWFSKRYSSMRRTAIVLALAFLLVAITHAALRHDLQLLLRCCLVALPASLLLMFAAVTLVELALAVTDELSAVALGSADGDVRGAFSELAKVLLPSAAAGPALPSFLIFIGAVVTALLALLVWLELVLREAAVYLAVAFLPLALAAAVWPRTLHWSRQLAGWLSALILAKLTIACAFSLAGAMVGGARPGSGGLSALLAGCAVLVLAAASPWILLRLIPFTAAGGEGLRRSNVSAAARQAPGAAALVTVAQAGATRGATAAAGAGAAAAGSRATTWAPAPARTTEDR
jgi:hypothetical protein